MTSGTFIPYPSPKLRVLAFAAGPPLRITLATKIHSLARYSERTLQHLSAVAYDHYEISSSFDSRSRVLFNVPSRYLYAIGLKTYSVLEVNASQHPAPYPRDSTQDTALPCGTIPTGLSPFCAARSRAVRIRPRQERCSPATPHLHRISAKDSVWTLPRSVALTDGISIDFFSCRY